MKAFRCEAIGVTCIVPAEKSSQAKYQVFKSANEIGYKVTFAEIKVRRASEFDEWALRQTSKEPRTVEYAEMNRNTATNDKERT